MNRETAKPIVFFICLAIAAMMILGQQHLKNPMFLAAIAIAVVLVLFFLAISRSGVPNSVLHGSARWATVDDLSEKGFIVDSSTPPQEGSLILGPAPNDPNKRIDLILDYSLRHLLILGSTGSGKGRGFFLWQLPNFNGSFVYCDPKGEGWQLASGYRKHSWRFAPRQPDNSNCFNWIPLCANDSHLCLTLAQAITMSGGASSGADSQFWIDAGSQYLAALFAHTSTFKSPTPAAAYDFATSYTGEVLLEQLLKSPNPIARQYATLFSAADSKLRGNVMIGANAKLIWLGDEKVRRFTSASLEPPDFGLLRKKKIGVYWVLSEKDVAVLKPLSTLFFTLILYQLKEVEGKVPVCLLLDELANVGRIPNLEVEITILRGRKIGLVLGIQSLEQLDNVYGQAAAKVIAGNCISKVVLGGLVDYYTIKYVSDLLGSQTISELSTSKSKQSGLFGKVTTSEQIVKTARPLMTPDEVRRIQKGQQLVIIDNNLPIISGRYIYTHPDKTAKATELGNTLTQFFPKIDSSDKSYYPNKEKANRNKQFTRN